MTLRVTQIGRELFTKLMKFSQHPAAIRVISTTRPCYESFDESMLDVLVCPLSKKPLRYDRDTNELICDEINVAYPIVNGIPNLVPHDARLIKEQTSNMKDFEGTSNSSSKS